MADTFFDMEPLVCDLPRIGRILSHMASSDWEVEKEDIEYLASKLENIGEKFSTLWYAEYERRRAAGS
ncbi:hypothetical protein [Magnetospirillum molischianum]|nr:hypothetical protein [Magnetospirillum molischianum]